MTFCLQKFKYTQNLIPKIKLPKLTQGCKTGAAKMLQKKLKAKDLPLNKASSADVFIFCETLKKQFLFYKLFKLEEKD